MYIYKHERALNSILKAFPQKKCQNFLKQNCQMTKVHKNIGTYVNF